MNVDFLEKPGRNYEHVARIILTCPNCGNSVQMLVPPKYTSDIEHIKYLEERLDWFQKKNIELELTISRLLR